MSPSTIVISLILAAIVAAIIVKLVRDKKHGKSIGCGCDCASCPSGGACGHCGGITPENFHQKTSPGPTFTAARSHLKLKS